jgi:hypothetical protein
VYNIALLEVFSPLESPSSFECEEGKMSKVGIRGAVQCVDKIKVLIQLEIYFGRKHSVSLANK